MADILISREDFHQIEQVIAERRVGHAGRDRDNLDRLEGELRRATRVAADDLPGTVVALGREVTVVDLADNSEETYRLVLPAQADVSRMRISVLAPIGAALLGYREGDQIEWPVPGGVRSLRIKQVTDPKAAARMAGGPA